MSVETLIIEAERLLRLCRRQLRAAQRILGVPYA